MDSFFIKLKQLRSRLLADPAWLLRAKAELMIFMSKHPVPDKHNLVPHPQVLGLPRLGWVLASFILFFGFISGSAAAVAQALPGQPLYAIKRGVFEPAAKVLARSDSERSAEFALVVANRRLSEVEFAVSEGKLRSADLAVLSKDAQVASYEAAEALDKLRSKANALAFQNISFELTTIIRLHSSALAALSERLRNDAEAVSILAKLRQEMGQSSALALKIDNNNGAVLAVAANQSQLGIEKAEEKLVVAKRSIEARGSMLDPATREKANLRMAKARSSLAKARQELKTQSPGNALKEAEDSLKASVETAMLVDVAAPLRLTVRVREPEPRIDLESSKEAGGEAVSQPSSLENSNKDKLGDLSDAVSNSATTSSAFLGDQSKSEVASSTEEAIELVPIESAASSTPSGGLERKK